MEYIDLCDSHRFSHEVLSLINCSGSARFIYLTYGHSLSFASTMAFPHLSSHSTSIHDVSPVSSVHVRGLKAPHFEKLISRFRFPEPYECAICKLSRCCGQHVDPYSTVRLASSHISETAPLHCLTCSTITQKNITRVIESYLS